MSDPNDLAERITRATLAAVEGGEPVATISLIAADHGEAPLVVGAKMAVVANGDRIGSLGGGPLEEAAVALAFRALERLLPAESHWLTQEGAPARRGEAGAAQVLIETFAPPETLLVVGGGHIGLSLATIGEHVGFSVTVLDDRPDYANRDRFPMADRVVCGDFVEELRRMAVTPNTFVVVVTRGHKQDEISLREVVGRGARYVGMIGSRRRVGAVLRHLLDDGVPAGELERVYTPIGLDLGAETPEEIAVSIMAQIIQVRREGSGRPMVERRARLASPAQADANP